MDVLIEGLEELSFVKLGDAVLCANCEVISNETRDGCCSACGSRALLSVSRLLGGTAQAHDSATTRVPLGLEHELLPESELEYLPVC